MMQFPQKNSIKHNQVMNNFSYVRLILRLPYKIQKLNKGNPHFLIPVVVNPAETDRNLCLKSPKRLAVWEFLGFTGGLSLLVVFSDKFYTFVGLTPFSDVRTQSGWHHWLILGHVRNPH